MLLSSLIYFVGCSVSFVSVDELLAKKSTTKFALFQLGFRPFFLGAGLLAVTLMAAWIISYQQGLPLNSYYGSYGWHSHEMLFGYAAAVVTGFLLTAVRNWTSIQTLQGTPLALLAGLWLAARLLHFFSNTLPGLLILLPDVLFLVLATVAVASPLIRARHSKSYLFIALLALLALGSMAVHADIMGWTTGGRQFGTNLGMYSVLLILAVMGGRVIPFFTERPIGVPSRSWPLIEKTAAASIFLLAVAHLFVPAATLLVGTVGLIAAVINAVRLSGWYSHKIWGHPLIWVLQLGYAWLVAGLVLSALANFGLINPLTALHGLTSGAIGVLTLGMMARVSLGHTGRNLVVSWPMALSFALVNLAALTRTLPYALDSERLILWLNLSGLLWIAGFAVFSIMYLPVLIKARVDGRPG
ncbi:MAG: NnrS family protein [Thiothrix sp.]|nr:MAG: NnrS family protein [Thiothrix sp.]